MSTVPIFAPDGTLGDVPYENMKAAIAAGGKPGVTIKAPDGSLGVVPAERTQDAVKAGGQIVPFEEQETQHPGFWHAVASDLAGLGKALPSALSFGSTPVPGHPGFSPGPAENATALAQADAARKARGEGLPYRAGAALATAAGTNVPGMEQSAAEGDIGGVAGHAAAGEALAASPLLAEGAGRMAAKVAPPIATGARIAGQTVKDVATPENIGTVVGGAVGYHAGGYFGGAGGAAIGRLLGKALAKRIADNLTKLPEAETGAPVYRDATLQRSRNIPEYAGEEESSAPAAEPPTAPPASPAAATAPAQRSIVTDPQTGRPEFSDVVAARDTRAGIPKQKTVSPAVEKQLRSAMAKASRGDVDGISPEEWDAIQHIETQVENTPKPAAQEEDLTDILNQSLAQIKARKQ